MTTLYELLEDKDPELYEHLTGTQNLLPQYYAFRWLSLLLSQEFLLPDVIRIWDSLFSDAKRFDFLLYVCCAMLINVRDEVLNSDFSFNMKLLQNYPSTDIANLMSLAVRLQDPDFRILEGADLKKSAKQSAEKSSKLWAQLTSSLTGSNVQ